MISLRQASPLASRLSAIAIAALAVVGCGSDSDDSAALSSLESRLTRYYESITDCTVTYTARTLYGEGDHATSKGSGELMTDCTWIASYDSHERFSIERDYHDCHPNLAHLENTRQWLIWDGMVARITNEESSGKASTTLSNAPSLEHYIDPSLSWLGCWAMQLDNRCTFLDVLLWEKVSSTSLADGVRRLTYIVPHRPHAQLLLDIGSDGTLSACELDQYYPSQDEAQAPSQLAARFRCEFGANPTAASSVLLSDTARIVVERFSPEGQPLNWNEVAVTAKAVVPRGSSSLDFAYSPATGTSVLDRRFGVMYDAGGHDMNVDGRILKCQSALSLDSALDLAGLAATGEWESLHVAKAANDNATFHDFGDVPTADGGRAVSHVFRFTNDTSSSITLKKASYSCGCVSATVVPTTLEPAATAVVTVNFVVSSFGVAQHAAYLLWSNDHVSELVVKANGTRGSNLNFFPIQSSRTDSTITLDGVLYVATHEPFDGSVPTIEPTFSIEFSGWQVVEPLGLEHGRRNRVMGRVRITMPWPDMPSELNVMAGESLRTILRVPLSLTAGSQGALRAQQGTQ